MRAAPTVVLTGEVVREEGQYVSHCKELDIVTCADTYDEVVRRTMDMITAYFAACVKTGQIEPELRKLGVGTPPSNLHDLRVQTDFKIRNEFSVPI